MLLVVIGYPKKDVLMIGSPASDPVVAAVCAQRGRGVITPSHGPSEHFDATLLNFTSFTNILHSLCELAFIFVKLLQPQATGTVIEVPGRFESRSLPTTAPAGTVPPMPCFWWQYLMQHCKVCRSGGARVLIFPEK